MGANVAVGSRDLSKDVARSQETWYRCHKKKRTEIPIESQERGVQSKPNLLSLPVRAIPSWGVSSHLGNDERQNMKVARLCFQEPRSDPWKRFIWFVKYGAFSFFKCSCMTKKEGVTQNYNKNIYKDILDIIIFGIFILFSCSKHEIAYNFSRKMCFPYSTMGKQVKVADQIRNPADTWLLLYEKEGGCHSELQQQYMQRHTWYYHFLHFFLSFFPVLNMIAYNFSRKMFFPYSTMDKKVKVADKIRNPADTWLREDN